MLSHFFIDRPIFATVISIVVVLIGIVSFTMLPVAQYPEVAPPTVQVSTNYPGANAKVVADTVAAPIEQEVNGVEDMLYMSSKCTNDGKMTLDVTFELGTDLDQAQVLVQNRVAIAEAKLPEEVKRQGVSTKKRSPNILLMIHILSKTKTHPVTKEEIRYYDLKYLNTYATTRMKDELARIKGVGEASILGARDLSMRIWLDPEKLKARQLTASDVVAAVREQNVQVAAGRLGQPPTPTSPAFQLTINTLGRLSTDKQFADIVVKTGSKGQNVYLRDVVRDRIVVVTLDPKKLDAHQLNTKKVIQALNSRNISAEVNKDNKILVDNKNIRFEIKTQIIDPAGLVVKAEEGKEPLLLKDIVLNEKGFNEDGIKVEQKGIEEAAQNYELTSYLNGQEMVTIAFYQQPGGNAVATRNEILSTLAKLEKQYPEGLYHRIVYDTTVFIEQSIDEVIETLIIAIILVFIVVLIFLQNWRSTIIPMVAVPVSLIGTFAFMALLGYSLNNLSLFGLVLAIGIVVDDAIVVVENVERNMSRGLSPRDATRLAMTEITGAVIATTLVMLAVFVPCTMISGITGQFFRQFAVTISVATVISSVNALTMSPALCALLLRPEGAKPDTFTRLINLVLGWFYAGFNKVFEWAEGGYSRTIRMLVRLSAIVMILYGGLLFLTFLGFTSVPTGFIPQQDKGYVLINVQLPDGASQERTEEVMLPLEQKILKIPGVGSTVNITGYSVVNSSNLSNMGSVFVLLKPFSERVGNKEMTANAVMKNIRKELSQIQAARGAVFGPPPVDGIGSTGGFKVQIKDTGSAGLENLQGAVANVAAKGNAQPQLQGLFSSFSVDQPQLFVDLDRLKAKSQKVSLTSIFDTLQVYLGSAYVNDITLYSRNWQVLVQADARYRLRPDDISKLEVRNAQGKMVPLSTLITVNNVSGPGIVNRYNMAPSAEINGGTAPGVSSGQAIDLMEKICRQELPTGMTFEWTELSLQQIKASEDILTKLAFPLAVVFVFLVLSAQYESWSLPLAIIMIVPMCLLCACAGILITSLDLDVFAQIGLVVLVGLSAKNAILIVEFAKQKEDEGLERSEATVEAAKLRLRPILMTAFSFILGVIPLLVATGAGAEMRVALGITVFSGMLGVTLFGLFLTPVFYVVIRWLTSRGSSPTPIMATEEGPITEEKTPPVWPKENEASEGIQQGLSNDQSQIQRQPDLGITDELPDEEVESDALEELEEEKKDSPPNDEPLS